MTEREKKLLLDMFFAGQYVEQFKEPIPSFEEFSLDIKTKSAIERQLLIIGEAAVKLRNEGGSFSISALPSIIGFRNILVHAYDQVNNETVWLVIQKSVPELLLEIEKLFTENGINISEL
jgi:uncharacterized protein with HEPN domain